MMIRLVVKTGLAGGAVYYSVEQGFWKDSPESIKAYNDLKKHSCPYVTQLTKQLPEIPIQLPKIPQTNDTTFTLKYYWNRGVISSFAFLSELPNITCRYIDKGVTNILESQTVKDLVGKSAPPAILSKDVTK